MRPGFLHLNALLQLSAVCFLFPQSCVGFAPRRSLWSMRKATPLLASSAQAHAVLSFTHSPLLPRDQAASKRCLDNPRRTQLTCAHSPCIPLSKCQTLQSRVAQTTKPRTRLRMQGACADACPPERIQAYAWSSDDLNRFTKSLSKENQAQIRTDKAVELREFQAAGSDSFSMGTFFGQLHSRRLGKIVLYNSTLPSTQTLLFKELSLDSDGTICLADRQSSGKGRGKNVWVSPDGCLVFSFTSHVKQPMLVPFYQYVVAMAMHRAVSQLVGGDAKQLLGLELKWPNDIYGPNMTKLGGVLCESTVRVGSPLFHVVAGVGINVLNSEPTTSLKAMMKAAGKEEAAAALTREALLAAFCPHFEVLLATLEADGFEALSDEYTRVWMHSGQSVRVQAEDGSGAREAVICGVSRTGFLLAADQQGRELELHPDGNSLDMLQGLIYQKQ